MAKKNELAKGDEAQSTALAVAQVDTGGGLVIEGDDSSASLSRLAMWQGTAEEEAKWPGTTLRRGDYYDTLSGEKIAEPKIIPIHGWMSWARWDKDSSRPAYSTRNKAEVPTEDLEWSGPDKTEPPKATECVNLIVMVEGQRWPYLMVFKRTGLKVFRKVIAPLEQRRGMTGQAHGVYKLGAVDDKNSNGQAFKRMTATPAGEVSPEMAATIRTIKTRLGALVSQAEKLAETPDGEDAANGGQGGADDAPF